MGRLPTGKTATAETRLYCRLSEPLKIAGHEWPHQATARFVDVAIEPLAEEEVKKEPSARSGALIKFSLKPGLPEGPVRQLLTLKTDLTGAPQVVLPIETVVANDITLFGRAWDKERAVVKFGIVRQAVGKREQLLLLVRGPLRDKVSFKVAKVTSDALRVTLEEPKGVGSGSIVQVPMVIEISPGGPLANHLGTEQGAQAEIVLETTHPEMPEFRLRVSFAVQE